MKAEEQTDKYFIFMLKCLQTLNKERREYSERDIVPIPFDQLKALIGQ